MPVIPAALVVVIVGGYFLFRRADVRLVLIVAAAAMFFVRATQNVPAVQGHRVAVFSQFFAEFARGLVNPASVIPICSAMGFAYVCKLTDCDAHLVHLLCSPLRRVRWLLIPGGIAVGFFVNSAIVSQTSTVAVVGPVLIPLLLGAGISPQTAGALLLLGGSMGGELLNPAAVEVTTISQVAGWKGTDLIHYLLPYNLFASGTALLVFWLLAMRHERRRRSIGDDSEEDYLPAVAGSIAASIAGNCERKIERVNYFKALAPAAPIILLMVVTRWVSLPTVFWPLKTENKITEQANIAAAMLIGVLCAGLTSPRRIGMLAGAFFEGAGFAYAQVISVIIAATMFAESINANGIIDRIIPTVEHAPALLTAAAMIVPWTLAAVTGTAVGTAPLVIKMLVPIAMRSGGPVNHGVHVGSLNAITAQFGRTSSPVAPVVITCAALSHVRPITLVKRVAIPLVVGGIVLFVVSLLLGS